MAKVILNKDYGGFLASYKAHQLYAKEKYGVNNVYIYKFWVDDVRDKDGCLIGYEHYYARQDDDQGVFNCYSMRDLGERCEHIDDDAKLCLDEHYREDKLLVDIVERLGKEASSPLSNLQVVEIPDELIGNYMIDDYDGWETLHQKVVEY